MTYGNWAEAHMRIPLHECLASAGHFLFFTQQCGCGRTRIRTKANSIDIYCTTIILKRII
jgi:hypothetical protein